ncbi:DUF883 family protein [Erwiniaceae bacterium L1_54_6]|jgi:ElaB/YqjD/DUF883 family membrane-anchored ribosome-binding protein|uniref:DUF883 domain-containing protein n=1 Tax=Pantoea cypripedii TaxID=55209 RepID=A0A1X1EXB6_PANCY|nr:DUF883 family protein [Pantoea cypripedii]MBP2194673.1 ElaB/YqjD/DUF883 family membrane-anchored ribosome-binding protein [Pantoea cypripedii]MDF7661798.1 DUF883 family protein [Erwiniaceae bacterium L1_54_6]ORM94571.1 hypothetical protein HA50_14895 [Pantoea cypripedii]QGY30263.1 DUF883 domain-containing protein [Pantoea cypripedii]
MFNRTSKNDDIDINQDVNELADSLEALLRSYGSEAKDEVESARSKAQSLLKQTRAKLNGNNRVSQAARDASYQVDAYVHDKPWHGVGIGAAVGLVIGALLVSRR